MAIITESGFTNSIQPGVKRAFAGALNNVPQGSLVGALYKMDSSEKADEKYLEIEDMGNVPVFTGDLAYTEFREGNTKTLTHQERALGLKIQRKLIDDDQYGIIESMVRMMGTSMRYAYELDAASPFVNATNTTYTVFDGLALGSTSHSFLSTSTTQSNLGTAAFSYAALDAAIIASRKFKNSQDRFLLDVQMDGLLGPVDLDSQMREVIESKLKPGNANNNINAYNSKFTILTTPFLSDTNDWFVFDSKRMKEYLIWIQRFPTEFGNDGTFDGFVKKYRVYSRYSNSPIHWPFVYVNSVS
jgi:phage major head subunit gpT-like protein